MWFSDENNDDMMHMKRTYPEVDLDVATASKFAVANLEGDGHPVVRVEKFVKALACVGAELDVVSIGDASQDTQSRCNEQVQKSGHDCVDG